MPQEHATPVQNVDSRTHTAHPEPVQYGPEAMLKAFSDQFKTYTSRIEHQLLEVSSALNLLVRWLSPVNSAAIASGSVPVAAASVIVLRQNPDRHFAGIVNADLANDVNLTLSANAIVLQGVTLRPGGVFTCGTGTDFKFTGEISAICNGVATATLTFIEA